jgi:hypothetical protein
LAEFTVYVFVPLMEQLLPAAGAVTSTQLPVVAESVAPPFTDQFTPFVTPLVTVAKMRRTLPGNTLKPNVGCVMAIAVGLPLCAPFTVSETLAELLADPEVPFTEIEYVPATAELLAVNVSELVELVVAALKAAVTPAGTPAAASETLLELLRPETLIVVDALPLNGSVRLLDDEDILNAGAEMVRATVVDLVVPPQVPCTVAIYVPGAAALLAAKVTEACPTEAAAGNAAVTPAGNPVALSTMLAEELIMPETVILLVSLDPPVKSARVLGEEESVKLGGGTVTTMVALPVSCPEVPVTTTM